MPKVEPRQSVSRTRALNHFLVMLLYKLLRPLAFTCAFLVPFPQLLLAPEHSLSFLRIQYSHSGNPFFRKELCISSFFSHGSLRAHHLPHCIVIVVSGHTSFPWALSPLGANCVFLTQVVFPAQDIKDSTWQILS